MPLDSTLAKPRRRVPARARACKAAAVRTAVAVVVMAAVAVATVSLAGCAAGGSQRFAPRTRLTSATSSSEKVPLAESTSSAGVATVAKPKVEASLPVSIEGTASPLPFSAEAAMRHVRYVADVLGVRRAGSDAERMAADYVVSQLKLLGYTPRVEEFPLPNGRRSRNVIAEKAGATSSVLVVGAHLDSKPPAPGANDAASGVGALLAMADELADKQVNATVQFVFFGSEEIIGADRSQHHFGSRHRVASMSAAEKNRTAGMLSLDMISVGDLLHARSMRRGPQSLVQDVLAFSRGRVPMTFKLDPGSTGQSDHEPYEVAGIPAVWIQTLPDPAYHTAGDVSSHIDVVRFQQVGQFVFDYVVTRTAADLARLGR